MCKLNLAEITCGVLELELKTTSSNGPLSMDIDEDQDGLEEHHCGASRLPHNSDHGPLWHRRQRPLLAEGLSGKFRQGTLSWITFCQLNQFHTNSEAESLSR